MDGPWPGWAEQTCVVCPAQLLGPGRFDVAERPAADLRYDPAVGWRVDPAGTAVCVHPYRVGLPPGRYASAGLPVPRPGQAAVAPTVRALELPDHVEDLEGWFVAMLRVEPDQELIFATVRHAEQLALGRFPPQAVVAALRRALSTELARR